MDVTWTLVYTILAIVAVRMLLAIAAFVNRVRHIEQMPGPKFKFPQGTLYEHPSPKAQVDFLKRSTAAHSKTGFRFWVGPFISVCVMNHPDLVRAILEDAPPKSPLLYRFVQPWLGDQSLLTLERQEWKHMRRLLTPAFHLHILKFYAPVVVETTQVLIDKFLALAKANPEQDHDVFDDFQLMTLDVICRAAFSYEGDPQRNPEDKYSQSIAKIAECIMARAQRIPHMFDTIYYSSKEGKEFQALLDYVHDHADKLIVKRREELQGLTMEDVGRARPGGRKLLDFLDILLLARDDDGKELPGPAIRHQCDTFLFAGHDTTSSALSWLSYCFSKHPEYQDKCREEIISQFGMTDEPTYEQAQQDLPFLTSCVKEALRMYPPIPGVGRVLEKPVKLPTTTLQPGTTAAIGILAIHYNPELWPEPETFKPERFAPGQKWDPCSFLPFSFGRRNCIGQNFALNEIRIAMCQLLRQLRFLPAADPNYKPEPMAQIVLRSQNGVRMRFEVSSL